MNVCVVGSTGLIGRSVVGHLAERGVPCSEVSRSQGWDLRDRHATLECFSTMQPSIIVNCAAHTGSLHYVSGHPATVLDDNLQIALSIYWACGQLESPPVVVNPLSNCSYPGNLSIQRETEWEMGPVHGSVYPFAMTRRAIYSISKAYYDESGVHSVNWIVPNTYGPGDRTDPARVHALNGIIIRMLHARKEKQRVFELWGSGTPVREWAYVEDVGAILVHSVLHPPTDQIYPLNFAQNRGYGIREVTDLVAEALEYDVEVRCNSKYQDGDALKILDDRSFRAAHPCFTFTGIREGIRKTVEYYEKLL